MPRSTVVGWLQSPPADVVGHRVLDQSEAALQAEVFRLKRRVGILTAVVQLLFVLVRVTDSRFGNRRLPDAADKGLLVGAVERALGHKAETRWALSA